MNSRAHWTFKAKRASEQKQLTAWMLKGKTPLPPPVLVHLTRIAPRLMDDDNSQTSLKAVRDAVAIWLGIDDGNREDIRFEYYQRKGPYAVQLKVEPWNK